MKNLFLIIATVLSFSATTFASNIIEGSLAIIKSERIDLSLESANQREFILSTNFNTESESIDMVFDSEVSMVQIFSLDGELEMVFPVASEKLNLGLSLFDNGQFRMGFMVEGTDEIQFTSLTVK